MGCITIENACDIFVTVSIIEFEEWLMYQKVTFYYPSFYKNQVIQRIFWYFKAFS